MKQATSQPWNLLDVVVFDGIFNTNKNMDLLLLGVERTAKTCVGSGIGYSNWNQDRVRVGFTRCGLDKFSSIFSALFKGIWQVVDNWLIGQQFSELWYHEDCTHQKWHSFYGINSYPWYQDPGTQSGRVSRVGFCAPITWRVRVGSGVRSTPSYY